MNYLKLKYLFSIFIVIIQCDSIYAQNIYFENRYDNHNDSLTADLCTGAISLDTGGYVWYGSFEYFFSNERYGSIGKVDKYGNIVDRNNFGWTNGQIELFKIHTISTQEYLAVGNYRNIDSNIIRPIITSIDPITLDTNWTKIIYISNDSSVFSYSSAIRNDSLFLTGKLLVHDSIGSVIETDAALMILDLNANIIYDSYWGLGNEYEDFSSFVFTSDFGLAIQGHSTSYGVYRRSIFLKLNNLFNVEWVRTEGPSDAISGGGGILSTQDGNLIIYQDEAQSPGTIGIERRTRIKKLTYGNSVIWSQLLYPQAEEVYSNSMMIEDHDSSLILYRYYYTPIITKLSSNGNLIWERALGVGTGSHKPWGLTSGNVEGYLMSGFYNPPSGMASQNNNQDTYLIKTNCMGFSSPPIAGATANTSNNFEVIMDNNSQYYDYAIWDWGDGAVDTTHNNEDRWGYTPDTLVSHVYGTQGVYNVTLIVGACGDEDTVQVMANAAISSTEWIEKGLVKVYPNPASNFLTVENLQGFGSPKFVLYNSIGKEVLHSDIGNNKIKRIQLDDFNNGVYIYRIVGNEMDQSGSLIIAK